MASRRAETASARPTGGACQGPGQLVLAEALPVADR